MNFQTLVDQNKLFDSHCHLNAEQYDADRGEVVKRAKKAGVDAIIDIGTDIESSKRAIENTERYDIVYAAIGIDPEVLIPGSDLFEKEVFDLDEESFDVWLGRVHEDLLVLAKNKKVLMIGETGIDNYWLNRTVGSIQHTVKDAEKSLKRQEELFRMHCRVSIEANKPLSIHSRNAIVSCLDVLESERIGRNMAVFHSLTPDIEDTEESFVQKLKSIRENGHYIGINGIYTFKNAKLIRIGIKSLLHQEFLSERTIEVLYDNGIVVETDGPFLSPEPHRGKRNEPGFIPHIIASIYSTVRT